jgi:type IV pilus assembly protein PilA
MNKTGFTLIELLILLVIIGVLASIGIPAYCTGYTQRARVAAGIVMAQNMTTRISTYAQTNKRLPDNINTEFFKLADDSIESMTWYPEQSALLTVFSPKIAKLADGGKYIVFSATGAMDKLQWQCSNKHALITNNPVPNRYLPHNCRSDSQ